MQTGQTPNEGQQVPKGKTPKVNKCEKVKDLRSNSVQKAQFKEKSTSANRSNT